jgi:hypothetical protein
MIPHAAAEMVGQGVAPGMLALCKALAPGGHRGFFLDFLRVDSRFLAELLALGPPNHLPAGRRCRNFRVIIL